MTRTLAGQTIVMSGGSRGIGLAIALRAARDGANIVLLAKSDRAHPKLSGTIHMAAAAIEDAGGSAVPVVGDVRDDAAVERVVSAAVEAFGGIDICINNASVLNLSSTLDLEPKRYDLMQDVNTRGTFMLTRACLPHLAASAHPQVLSLSPPINLSSQAWLARFPGYLLAKYGMTLATLAITAEHADQGLAGNTLWPRTTIATDAVRNLLGGEEALSGARTPEIVADAAHALLTGAAGDLSGRTLIDDDVLAAVGITDLSRYSVDPAATKFDSDFFLD